jgi:hypothetical protein
MVEKHPAIVQAEKWVRENTPAKCRRQLAIERLRAARGQRNFADELEAVMVHRGLLPNDPR